METTYPKLKIHDNPDGWGPPLDLPPEKFRDMPYALFSKSDRLGRIADWTNTSRYGQKEPETEESASAFTMVDSRPQRAGLHVVGAPRGKPGFRQAAPTNRKRFDAQQMRNRDPRRQGPYSYGMQRRPARQWSIPIDPNWEKVAEFTFSNLSKASYKLPGSGETIMTCGALQVYDRANDKISCKNVKPLERFEHKAFHYVTTTDDPVIRQLAGKNEANVFITSTLFTHLVTAPRSVNSWDVIVQRVGDCLFFDKRENSNIDLVTVNETANDPPRDDKDDINSYSSLCLEATLINQNFSQAVLTDERRDLDSVNPFVEEDDEPASVGYLYRRWEVSEDITVVVRCEVDGILPSAGATAASSDGAAPPPPYVVIKALNEVPTTTAASEWRTKLDTQLGAVLSTEMKNNAAKLARWTAQSLLADATQLRLGFVTRANVKDNTSHVILGSQTYKPQEFAMQLALSPANMWGIFKMIVDSCYKYIEDGCKGILVKDPNQPVLRLYQVPEDAFEEAEEENPEAEDFNDDEQEE